MNIVVKRIVCLANSRKTSGRCIAGLEFIDGVFGQWIRPVSGHGEGELSQTDRTYVGHSEPAIFDVIDVPLLEPIPHQHQSENWLNAKGNRWVFVDRLSDSEIAKIPVSKASLWQMGSLSTIDGRNDQVSADLLPSITHSISWLKVDKIRFKVSAPGAKFGNPKRKVQGQFVHASETYHLRVTDPIIEEMYLKMNDGTYESGSCYLTVSLGEPYSENNHSQKLIAAVIPMVKHE